MQLDIDYHWYLYIKTELSSVLICIIQVNIVILEF